MATIHSQQSNPDEADLSRLKHNIKTSHSQQSNSREDDTVTMARQEREKQGPCEVECSYGGEADLHRHLKACDKNPGHQKFIPVDKFNVDCLPGETKCVCKTDVVDLVRAISDLTVRVTVKYVSSGRPEIFPGSDTPYPCYKGTGSNLRRVGTGIIWKIEGCTSHENCSCKKCLNSSAPEKHFARIYINTATHVVFDKLEGEHTTCHLFFDRGGTPDICSGVVSLSGMSEVRRDISQDWCTMTYMTHDLDLIDRLEKMVKQCEALHRTLKISQAKPISNNIKSSFLCGSNIQRPLEQAGLDIFMSLNQFESDTQPSVPKTEPDTQPPVPKTESDTQSSVPKTESDTQSSVPKTESDTQSSVPKTESDTQPSVPKTESDTQPPVPKTESDTQPPVPKTESDTQKSSSESRSATPRTSQTESDKTRPSLPAYSSNALIHPHPWTFFPWLQFVESSDVVKSLYTAGGHLQLSLSAEFNSVQSSLCLDVSNLVRSFLSSARALEYLLSFAMHGTTERGKVIYSLFHIENSPLQAAPEIEKSLLQAISKTEIALRSAGFSITCQLMPAGSTIDKSLLPTGNEVETLRHKAISKINKTMQSESNFKIQLVHAMPCIKHILLRAASAITRSLFEVRHYVKKSPFYSIGYGIVKSLLQAVSEIEKVMPSSECPSRFWPTLTIIVSHPHGCSKQVSVGHYTDTYIDRGIHYRYNTATCPGSSGAYVFVVGRDWLHWQGFELIHCGRCEENTELNYSGPGLQ